MLIVDRLCVLSLSLFYIYYCKRQREKIFRNCLDIRFVIVRGREREREWVKESVSRVYVRYKQRLSPPPKSPISRRPPTDSRADGEGGRGNPAPSPGQVVHSRKRGAAASPLGRLGILYKKGKKGRKKKCIRILYKKKEIQGEKKRHKSYIIICFLQISIDI